MQTPGASPTSHPLLFNDDDPPYASQPLTQPSTPEVAAASVSLAGLAIDKQGRQPRHRGLKRKRQGGDPDGEGGGDEPPLVAHWICNRRATSHGARSAVDASLQVPDGRTHGLFSFPNAIDEDEEDGAEESEIDDGPPNAVDSSTAKRTQASLPRRIILRNEGRPIPERQPVGPLAARFAVLLCNRAWSYVLDELREQNSSSMSSLLLYLAGQSPIGVTSHPAPNPSIPLDDSYQALKVVTLQLDNNNLEAQMLELRYYISVIQFAAHVTRYVFSAP
jgi:hypothetical protein